jgi:MFS family permease
MNPKFFYGYIIVSSAFFIMVAMQGTIHTFGVFFKPLLTDFGWTRAETSGAFSLFQVLHGLLYIVTGRLNDRFGPRAVMTACSFFVGAGYILMSQISAIWHLYLVYGVIIAIGMSGSFVPLLSTIAKWFVKRRGLMTGIFSSGIGIGTVIMPPIASGLIISYGWRTSYIIIGSITLLLVILAAQFLRRDPTQVGQLPYGVDKVKGEGLNLEIGGFSPREAIRTWQFWVLSGVFVCSSFCTFAITVHIVPHAIDKGISITSAASILTIIGGLSFAGRIIMGSSGDRIGNKLALIICSVIMVIALSWVVVAKELWMLRLFAAIFGFAYGGFVTIQSPLVAELFGLRAHGVILGAVMFITASGGAVGSLLTGHIFDITESYHLAFLVCVALSVVGLILISILRPTSNKGGSK